MCLCVRVCPHGPNKGVTIWKQARLGGWIPIESGLSRTFRLNSGKGRYKNVIRAFGKDREGVTW